MIRLGGSAVPDESARAGLSVRWFSIFLQNAQKDKT